MLGIQILISVINPNKKTFELTQILNKNNAIIFKTTTISSKLLLILSNILNLDNLFNLDFLER